MPTFFSIINKKVKIMHICIKSKNKKVLAKKSGFLTATYKTSIRGVFMAIREDGLRNLSFYHESKADRIAAHKSLDSMNILVKLDDGSHHIYNEERHNLRPLPDLNNMSDEEYLCELGRTLERMMYYKGISQFEMSERTGISQTTISRYIAGKISPSYYNLDKIARVLNCSMEDFKIPKL